MLKKLLLSVVMIGISFVTGYATAQSYFNNKLPAPGPLASAEPQNTNVLSPSDFQSQTQQMQEKKNQALSDQLKEDLAKIPPTTPPPPPEPHTPSAAGAAGPAPAGQEAAPETNQSTAAAPPASPAPTQEVAPVGAAPAAPPATAPGQTQVYTGFQNQNQNQNPSPASPPANSQSQPPAGSGGWNIKY